MIRFSKTVRIDFFRTLESNSKQNKTGECSMKKEAVEFW